ncbi:PP2C family protein-serine/threonine phosphatase [endosymbiont of Ridgeia piscesae]|jgi:protein phosphatase|nr:protein phosphatase 2C domain-containing protein [endosymbiont of Ridgeia piscesae]KRT57349.1 protein phosphatase [endosymbiont of Ridgeia piscesae]
MRTDTGVVRQRNEDAVGADPDAGIVILADGMGGANAGDVASNLAVNLLLNRLLDTPGVASGPVDCDQLRLTVQEVNSAIYSAAQEMPECKGMGTTLVLGMFRGNDLIYGHVGDSRLYRLRGGELEMLTRDHSLVEELVAQEVFSSTEEARRSGVPGSVLSRAYGIFPYVEVDLEKTRLETGDLYLLCTDGLNGMLSANEIHEYLMAGDEDLEQTADQLIEAACEKGGMDNVSVILVRVWDDKEAELLQQ